MEYREIPSLNAKVSLLGLGCMRFPWSSRTGVNKNSAKKLFDLAYSSGVNYFDTAYNYLDGTSEALTGKMLSRYPRDSFYLATKLPNWLVHSREDAERIFNEQLQRLGMDYIDFYLLHSLSGEAYDRMAACGAVEFCEEMQRAGKIRNFGFSFHDSYDKFEHIITSRKWDFCQIQLNYMDVYNQAGLRGYELAEKLGVPLIIMEPLKGGMLSKMPPKIQKIFDGVVQGRSPSSWSLRWLAAKPNIKVILSGMSYPWQMQDNIATMESLAPFTDAERLACEEVREAILSRVKNSCTGCSYCMPCPNGANIPEIFRKWNETAMYGRKSGDRLWRYDPNNPEPDGPNKCIACGKCEQLCPQHLAISEDMKSIVEGK